MSSSQMQMKRLRKKSVSVAEMDMYELKPRMIDHLRVSKPSLFRRPATERESNGGAEFVEDGSVVIRSGTVQHSKDHPMFGLGFGPKKQRIWSCWKLLACRKYRRRTQTLSIRR